MTADAKPQVLTVVDQLSYLLQLLRDRVVVATTAHTAMQGAREFSVVF